jgi:L-alanine-DL-glutamate epimerase-like enolase superfamily enzyme
MGGLDGKRRQRPGRRVRGDAPGLRLRSGVRPENGAQGWRAGRSVAAATQLAMVTLHMPLEFLPADLCESCRRKELTIDELVFEDGSLRPPERPGLGVDLKYDALEDFSGAAAEAIRG